MAVDNGLYCQWQGWWDCGPCMTNCYCPFHCYPFAMSWLEAHLYCPWLIRSRMTRSDGDKDNCDCFLFMSLCSCMLSVRKNNPSNFGPHIPLPVHWANGHFKSVCLYHSLMMSPPSNGHLSSFSLRHLLPMFISLQWLPQERLPQMFCLLSKVTSGAFNSYVQLLHSPRMFASFCLEHTAGYIYSHIRVLDDKCILPCV